MIITPLHAINFQLLLAACAYLQDPCHFKNMQKPGKTLIVFSKRNGNPVETNFVRSLWHEESSNLTYVGKKHHVTMDVKPALSEGSHIVGDVLTYKLPHNVYRTLYLERPPTHDCKSEDGHTNNLVERYLKNLLPALKEGGEVVVEWHPFIEQEHYCHPQKTKEYKDAYAQKNRIKNPFTGFFDYNIIRLAIFYAIKNEFQESEYSPSFLDEAKKLSKAVDYFLHFYTTQQKATRADLNKRLLLELGIFELMETRNVGRVWVPVDMAESITAFNEAVDHVVIRTRVEGKAEAMVCMKLFVDNLKKAPTECRYFQFSSQELMSSSLYYFLAADLSVYTNKDFAIKCLENLGLTHVTLSRGTSRENGRTNVWLLKGYKINESNTQQ